MRKLFVFFILFLLPMFLFAGQGDFYNGYEELLADDTLSMDRDTLRLKAWGDAGIEWSTTRDTFGVYSAKISLVTAAWDSAGQVVVLFNYPLDSLEADGALSNIYMWIYNESANNPYPVIYIDTLGGSTVNYQFHGNTVQPQTKNAWVKVQGGYQHTWVPHFYVAGKPYGAQDGTAKSLALWNVEYPDAQVLYVGIQFANTASGVLYVDDITVNDIVYTVEPENAYDLTVTTTLLEQFSDTLYFDFALLAKEVGSQGSEIDIRLQYSPDGSNWSAAEILENDLDLDVSAPHQWYFPNIGSCADGLYSMKNVRVIIDNSGYYIDNTNKIVIESFGITFKKEQ